jgi:hypothetical protein
MKKPHIRRVNALWRCTDNHGNYAFGRSPFMAWQVYNLHYS